MLSLAKLFQLGVTRPIQKVAILTNGGGPSAVAADQVEMSHSLTLAQLSESTEKELHKVLPPMAAVGNPIDVIGDALSGRFIDALRVLRADKDVEGILGIVTPQLMTEMEKTAMAFMKSHSKPIMPIFIGGQEADRGRATLQKKNVPNFDFPIDAIRALDALANNLPKPNNAKAAGLSPSKAPLRLMSFAETQEILSKHKLSISGVLVKNLQSLTSALEHSSGPMAMKISSPDIIHKTDVGGVVLNIRTLDEAIDARERILGNLKNIKSLARVEGVVVQPMVSGQEVIVGMKRDRTFGPAMVVGLGGIFTEVMHDTSLRVAPITPQEAVQMLSETKGFAVLQGVRGGKKVNIAALADIISKLSRLALEHPEIQEIDLNPVIVSEKGAVIADARFLANK
jgi:acetyltransferase